MDAKYSIGIDSTYGYRRLEPLPTPEELENFYRDKYYDLIAAGGRAPELRRLLTGGAEAQSELDWLRHTLWQDIYDVLNELIPLQEERALLDIGCGTGHFGEYMLQRGWSTIGIEPSKDAAEVAKGLGLATYSSIEQLAKETDYRFDAVTLLNMLEHVVDPVGLLQSIHPFIHEKTVVVIRVPNDFTALQLSAQKKLDRNPWWVVIPDHINYFNFGSLETTLGQIGFKVVQRLSDFPMEFFLLFGDDYTRDSAVGNTCHKKRIGFELSIPPELRRTIYRSFAESGIGRNCLVFAQVDKSASAGAGAGAH